MSKRRRKHRTRARLAPASTPTARRRRFPWIIGVAGALVIGMAAIGLWRGRAAPALDPNQIIEIRQLIREIGREKTIILSTHILPEVSATCNRMLIISDARLVASGTPDELVSRAQGAEVITAGIKGPEEAVFETLRQADFITEFRKVREERAGEHTWLTVEIQGQGDQTGEKLFHLAVRNGWTLRELRLEKLSLEEVFARLTTA